MLCFETETGQPFHRTKDHKKSLKTWAATEVTSSKLTNCSTRVNRYYTCINGTEWWGAMMYKKKNNNKTKTNQKTNKRGYLRKKNQPVLSFLCWISCWCLNERIEHEEFPPSSQVNLSLDITWQGGADLLKEGLFLMLPWY